MNTANIIDYRIKYNIYIQLWDEWLCKIKSYNSITDLIYYVKILPRIFGTRQIEQINTGSDITRSQWCKVDVNRSIIWKVKLLEGSQSWICNPSDLVNSKISILSIEPWIRLKNKNKNSKFKDKKAWT